MIENINMNGKIFKNCKTLIFNNLKKSQKK